MTPHGPAYELVSERELPEYRSRGLLFRHKKTGCELYRLESEDEENVFAFVFRTRPRDNTGVAHIVEHSVLCGSERFPVKDSFLVMTRRSLATFMNAFTYPDKTVYPAASAVEADYFNLMDVYGDAVFFPRLTEDVFLQEAHRLELGEDGSLDIKGVVYNEMRGDYPPPSPWPRPPPIRASSARAIPTPSTQGATPGISPTSTTRVSRHSGRSTIIPPIAASSCTGTSTPRSSSISSTGVSSPASRPRPRTARSRYSLPCSRAGASTCPTPSRKARTPRPRSS